MYFLKPSYEYLNDAPPDFDHTKICRWNHLVLNEDIEIIRLKTRDEIENWKFSSANSHHEWKFLGQKDMEFLKIMHVCNQPLYNAWKCTHSTTHPPIPKWYHVLMVYAHEM